MSDYERLGWFLLGAASMFVIGVLVGIYMDVNVPT